MKLTAILLIIALIVPLVGCDKLTLDDPKVTKLEEQLKSLEAQLKETNNKLLTLGKQYNDLVTANIALMAEKKDLSERLSECKTETVANTETKKVSFTVELANNKLYNKPRAKEVAINVLNFAKKHDFKVKLTVEGYSTKIGDADYNMWLSKERAEGVFHKIMGMAGSDAIRFSNTHVIAHGEESDDARKVVVTIEVLE
jgi:outer membrane protein OmpA-like peptidoglycan-associated protein